MDAGLCRYRWEAKILLAKDGKTKIETVPDKIKDVIEQAWFNASLSPYETREKSDPDPPPENWKFLLEEYVNNIMPSEIERIDEMKKRDSS